MVKLMRTATNNFDEIITDLIRAKYTDTVIGSFAGLDVAESYKSGYTDFVRTIATVVNDFPPTPDNITYPNCINASFSSYGFRYIKDNYGISVNVKTNKNGEVTYYFAFIFNRTVESLKNNPVYRFCMENGYEVLSA